MDKCGAVNDEEDDDDLINMFVATPMGSEWGGPTHGGKYGEPTKFGDWCVRDGRCTDF